MPPHPPVLRCPSCAAVGTPKLKPGPSPYVQLARCSSCGSHIKAIPRRGWAPGRIDDRGARREP
jgi:hypothetical protein